MIGRKVNQHRRLRRYSLKQQRLDSLDAAIGMKALTHNAAVEHIVYSHQAHTLMMTHVGIDDDSTATLAFLLAGVIQRLVESPASVHASLLQTLEIPDRFLWLDQQGQSCGVRRHNQVVLQPTFQAQRRNTCLLY